MWMWKLVVLCGVVICVLETYICCELVWLCVCCMNGCACSFVFALGEYFGVVCWFGTMCCVSLYDIVWQNMYVVN